MTAAPPPDWVPLLVPDMPPPQALLPWLERMHAARHYSNFGPLVRELESAFAQRFAVHEEQLTTVTNATLGMELVLQTLDLAPGSRVLVPAFTFVATATAVVRAGHVPVLADVDADTWLLTPAIARAACAATRIHAVLPVATFGMPHHMPAWQQFEQDTGMPVVMAHVVVERGLTMDDAADILSQLQNCLREHFPVSVPHTTFQLEPEGYDSDSRKELHS